MAVARTPRRRWIEEGLRALAAGGPEAVRIEVLAQALGVSKGGFYGYFADREALLAQLTMQGVSHANAVSLGRRFLEAIEWAR